MKKKTWVLVPVMALAVAAAAHAQQWTMSLGANYRSFDDIDMHQLQFANPHNQYDEYVNGALLYSGAGAVIGVVVESELNQFDPPGFQAGEGDDAAENIVNLDGIAFRGDTEGDSGGGVVVEAIRPLARETSVPMSLVLSLTTASLSTCSLQPGVVLSDAYQINDSVFAGIWTEPSPLATLGAPDSGQYIGPPGQVQASGAGTASTYGSLDYDIDMDALTLGAGVSGKFCIGSLNVLVGAGPTLTIADIDVEADEVVRWNADDSLVYSRRHSDSSTQVRLGAYANIGLQIAITERLGVAAEYRYDCAVKDVTTGLADVDLSGGSGQIKVTYSF